MQSFLTQIAKHYYREFGSELTEIGFVFPNRRAGLFFRKALAKEAGHPIFAPDILGINELLMGFSNLKQADHITLLFELFEEFRLLINPNESFDQFVAFGSMLLNDFNEIDKYLVDANQLFHNIADLNEIEHAFNYLTEEQIEVIRNFWGHFLPNNEKEFNKRFVDLWRQMQTLYMLFTERLRNKELGYDGMIFRDCAIKMQLQVELAIGYKRLVFIGFNALTPTEKVLFDYFKKRGIADYYFDYHSSWILNQPQSAGLFAKANLREYKSAFALQLEPDNVPELELIAAPSQIGQTKQIYRLLKETKEEHPNQPLQTAVVLPDESLLTPLLHAIPDGINTINVTMGYPLSLTPLAALMAHIAMLQKEVREQKGSIYFYFKPVLAILNHPYIYATAEKEIAELHKQLTNENLFLISADKIGITPLLKAIFIPQTNVADIVDYLKQLIDTLRTHLILQSGNALDKEFFYQYSNAFNRLCDNLQAANIQLNSDTFFKLLKQVTATISIPFKGEPLMGLQIMGMLETRGLDFEHLIIASFNDDIIPRKEQPQSIVPYNLRKAFDMPTYENNDAIYAYNFYRLFTRAKKITFIYDSSSDGKVSEISRFYYQLKYLFNLDIKEQSLSYNIKFNTSESIVIKKEDAIAESLNSFLTPGGESLSASAINQYINCPLQFYFSRIAKLNEEGEIDEKLQANVFGTIYHKVMEQLYSNLKNREVTSEMVQQMIESTATIDRYITDAFNSYYFKSKESQPLTGFNLLVGGIIRRYVQYTLRYDKSRAP